MYSLVVWLLVLAVATLIAGAWWPPCWGLTVLFAALSGFVFLLAKKSDELDGH